MRPKLQATKLVVDDKDIYPELMRLNLETSNAGLISLLRSIQQNR